MLAQVNLGDSVQEMLTRVLNFLPQLVAFLLILLIGWFVAKVIARLLDRGLERVGFDRAVERGGVGAMMRRADHEPSDVVSRIIFYALMLFVVLLAFGVFGENPVSDLLYGVIAFLPRLFVAIVIVVVAGVIANAVRDMVVSAIGGLPYGRVVANIASATIVVIGVFAALSQLQIAPAIVNGLFYAVLAIIVGSTIVAVGGGGIVPMRRQWERAMSRVDEEVPLVREEAQGSTDAEGRAELRRRETEPTPGSQGPYADKTLEELHGLAQERNVPGRANMSRGELVDALRDDDREKLRER